LIGYELAKIEALFRSFPGPGSNYLRIGITGSGEGGLLSLYAGAFSSFDVTMVSGYFGPRHRVWEEPIDRNIFGLLENFGDAEIGALVLPRSLLIEPRPVPELVVGGNGAAPGRISNASSDEINQEFQRLLGYAQKMNSPVLPLKVPAGVEAIQTFFQRLTRRETPLRVAQAPAQLHRPLPDSTARMNVQISELEQHNEGLLADSAAVRTRFMKGLDFSSLSNYVESARGYREYFATNIIGRFDDPRLTLNPRTRLAYEGSNWLGYEVVLDVFTNVTAYGILLLPKDLKPGERRPVVVCQHGLEGRPQELIKGDHPAYHDYAARLAEEGFITFSPQNLYLFKDRFRTLQRKANPLKKTLFSIITPQHEAILTWLKTLPQVDPARIGFYGLSYGGKTAMRVPALLEDYAFSICSADFNEWVWKNASTRSPYSYVGTGEYEIFEWNLAQTFNYAEMAALIAPRPFMVERGHFDNVAPDEMVAHEYAKVRHLYAVNLRIPERTEIEWFVGPHTINGKGTFDFARRHLQWPPPR
jgi:cephalosporin-C deacetylase-like acetyl esterase